MKLLSDKPFGLPNGTNNFICMGIISDSGKDYACLLQLDTKVEYIEEIHWGIGKNISTASLHQIDNDQEWETLLKFVTKSTTIFSPAKVNQVLQQKEMYFYTAKYKETDDYAKRKQKGTV